MRLTGGTGIKRRGPHLAVLEALGRPGHEQGRTHAETWAFTHFPVPLEISEVSRTRIKANASKYVSEVSQDKYKAFI